MISAVQAMTQGVATATGTRAVFRHRVVVSIRDGQVSAVYGDDVEVEVLIVDHDGYDKNSSGRFTNFYRHTDCPAIGKSCSDWPEWEDSWSCMVDDECPECGAEMTPYESVENLSSEVESAAIVPLARMSAATKERIDLHDMEIAADRSTY